MSTQNFAFMNDELTLLIEMELFLQLTLHSSFTDRNLNSSHLQYQSKHFIQVTRDKTNFAPESDLKAAPITLDKVPPFDGRYSFLAPSLPDLPECAASATCAYQYICLTDFTGTGACVQSTQSPFNWWNWFDYHNDDYPAGQ